MPPSPLLPFTACDCSRCVVAHAQAGGEGGGGSVRVHCAPLPSPPLPFTVCVCSLCVVALALLPALALLLAVIVRLRAGARLKCLWMSRPGAWRLCSAAIAILLNVACFRFSVCLEPFI